MTEFRTSVNWGGSRQCATGSYYPYDPVAAAERPGRIHHRWDPVQAAVSGLGIFFASFCRNRVGENVVKRRFQAPNLEPFKTLIGARLNFERNWAINIRIHYEFI